MLQRVPDSATSFDRAIYIDVSPPAHIFAHKQQGQEGDISNSGTIRANKKVLHSVLHLPVTCSREVLLS
jgi:hypothetical protein